MFGKLLTVNAESVIMKQIYESFSKHRCTAIIIICITYFFHINTRITQWDLLPTEKLLIITLIPVGLGYRF